jgi:hypothetical protein
VPLVGKVTLSNYQCGSKDATMFTILVIAYKVVLTIVGAILAFKVRSLGSFIQLGVKLCLLNIYFPKSIILNIHILIPLFLPLFR